VQFAQRWEITSSAEADAIRPLFVSRDVQLRQILGRPGLVALIGRRGSGKTALAYQVLATEGLQSAMEVVQGWAVPGTADSRAQWFNQHAGCRALLIDDFGSALQADAIVFVSAALARSIRVLLTSTEPLELPGALNVHLPDLTVNEARHLLSAQNGLTSPELRLPSDVIDRIVALAPKLKTPRALISVAYRCITNPSQRPEQALEHLEGTLYELPLPQFQHDASRIMLVNTIDALLQDLRKQPASLFRLPSRRFEEVVAELLRNRGCAVHLTPSTRDGGFDMYASFETPLGRMLCLVEAKRYAPEHPVGVDVVRHLYGTLCANDANSAMLVTTSRFTKDAEVFQNKFRQVLALRDYFDLAEWIASYGRSDGPAA
jgi:HJR/Mrr/RecB family endonuclease